MKRMEERTGVQRVTRRQIVIELMMKRRQFLPFSGGRE